MSRANCALVRAGLLLTAVSVGAFISGDARADELFDFGGPLAGHGTELMAVVILLLIGGSIALFLVNRRLRRTRDNLTDSVAELTTAQQALREGETNFRQLTENMREVFWMTTPDKRQRIYVSPAYWEVWGHDPDIPIDELGGFLESVHPDDRERVAAAASRQAEGGYDETYRIVRPDGTQRWIHDRAYPVLNDSGEAYRIAGLAEDITAQVAQQEQLHRAQRMEAVGQLTGGVAHDFNNLLAVILGYGERLEKQLDEDGRKAARAIIDSAKRGGELSHRLLAYSRQQQLQAEKTDIYNLVVGVAETLRRTLGETITVDTDLADGLCWALIDPHQLDNALLNLAINARDAMPDGGRLTVATDNVSLDAAEGDVAPGDYVRLTVSDTGTGMAPDVLAHAFEPFFTTREVGEGSGLGLSMVYGFLKQSGGHVAITSEQGAGTAVHLYLPKTDPVEMPVPAPVAAEEPMGRGETILVLEDDAAVRRLVAALLRDLGYRALKAANGAEAFAHLENRPEIDLLLSDVVLADGESGPETVSQAQRRYPGLKSLFVSGYAPTDGETRAALKAGATLLHKPFTRQQLAEALRDVLGEESLSAASNG